MFYPVAFHQCKWFILLLQMFSRELFWAFVFKELFPSQNFSHEAFITLLDSCYCKFFHLKLSSTQIFYSGDFSITIFSLKLSSWQMFSCKPCIIAFIIFRRNNFSFDLSKSIFSLNLILLYSFFNKTWWYFF